MKTTFDLPEELLMRGKIAAAKRRTSLKNLVVEGLENVLSTEGTASSAPRGALQRLRRGYRLSGPALSREEVHGR